MPVRLHFDPSYPALMGRTNSSRGNASVRSRESDTHCLHIGLMNNMPDGALEATERQFVTVLDAAADRIVVHLSLYALPEVPRSEQGRHHLETSYSGIETLWNRHFDGFIITGAEPRAAHLRDEPYWQSLVKVLEWTDLNTSSTVLSCLSAHAALLHFDGVERRRLEHKRFGVFKCNRVTDHPLTSCTPSHYPTPQSRWNEIPEKEIIASGYLSLTRLADGGVDTFVKQQKSMFVFFQGHPEYEPDTLYLEYRRDIGRYLKGETDYYPHMPVGYFDQAMAGALRAFQSRALCDRRRELLAQMPALQLSSITSGNHWRSAAVQIYSNWLADLCARKERRTVQLNANPVAVSTSG
jgi:homoserine O-succinyltransferase/O-acetyltransferase